MTFGEKVRRLRKEKGWTQAELAKLSGLSLRTIISYEKGESYPKKRSTYDVLAEIFEIPSVELRSEIDELDFRNLPEIPESNILAEPCARNTAPCIAFACWKIKKKHPRANIVVTPSDALVIDTGEFRRVMEKALRFTDDSSAIVTIGIRPTRPETGYGYIAAANQLQTDKEIYTVDAFKEKPDKETAEKYLAEGNYFWNAGIFVWNVRTITSVMRVYAPGIAQIFDRIFPDFYTEKENETIKKLFPTCESISIDYAVMEKAEAIYVLPASFGWSDLGTWGALRGLLPQDKSGNATVGADIRLYDSKNCIVHASEEKRVVVQGLDGYIIAEKDNTLLICKLEEEQRIKEFSK